MTSIRRKRILITTAGFGDGHNSAARNLARALEAHADVLVTDPCAGGAPHLNSALRSGYLFATTYWPWIWHRIYLSAENRDFSKPRIPMIHRVERHLHDTLREFQPDLVASTYPLYPYFLKRSFQNGVPTCPVVTIITDSFSINAAWRKAPTDYWLVTDSGTRQSLLDLGLPEGRVVETGFPVDPRFSELTPVPADDPAKPFRVLFFPTSKKPTVRRIAKAILNHDSWPTEITIVLGRNVRKLHQRAREIQEAYPGRVHLKGWTKKVPELLCSHHLLVGKAGGATVHEALAARCPMLIHHLIPGQEVGNLELLRKLGGGDLADTPESLAAGIRDLTADHAALWRRQKRNLARHARPNASATAARFLLDTIDAQQP